MLKHLSLAVACALTALLALPLSAQTLTQTVKGRVVDRVTQEALVGATVKTTGTDAQLGATTDGEGFFRLAAVPVGRVSLEVAYLGYEPAYLNNIVLTSGKELVLTVELDEKIGQIAEVVVKATRDKAQTNNEMATLSARTFSIEESQRYAGSRNDVARMAQNFAGVRGANDAMNDIVIRGNAPRGLLWRLDGVDIPNPNHYGDLGATGGPVSMLNTNVLQNSDFLTAAFPAEYGNALSGVFDLRMRNGNDERHEFLGQVGINGFELGAEGPISRDSRASYLVNYRYSALGLMNKLGIDFGTGAAIPYYQDGSFKLNFPTKKAGTFSVFGLGGISSIDLLASATDTSKQNLYNDDLQDVRDRNYIGMAGASYQYIFDDNTYARITLAATTLINTDDVDSLDRETRRPADFYGQRYQQSTAFVSAFVKKKFTARHNVKAGVIVQKQFFDLRDSIFIASENRYRILSNDQDETWLIQPYAQYQFRINQDLTFNYGLHYQYLAYNRQGALEPRAGFNWRTSARSAWSLGYGLHSQAPLMQMLVDRVETAPGQYIQPNRNVGFTRAHHVVLGYDYKLSETLRVKTEAYYQHIFDAVVQQRPTPFSMLNFGGLQGGWPDTLMNGGTGTNYGVELTLEKFMDKGLYYLVTGSLYRSTYKGSDGVEKRTAYDGTYAVNVLGGKEFRLGRATDNGKAKFLFADARLTAAGGQRYVPVDVEKSRQEGEAYFDWDRAFEEKLPDYFRADVNVGLRLNKRRTTQEFSISVQNVTNRRNAFFQNWDARAGEVETVYQLGLFPLAQYKIEF